MRNDPSGERQLAERTLPPLVPVNAAPFCDPDIGFGPVRCLA
jgi:hypothetical protein